MNTLALLAGEIIKMAEEPNVKKVSQGSVPHFKSPAEVDKYRESIRQHLSKPEVAARIAARRKRTFAEAVATAKTKDRVLMSLDRVRSLLKKKRAPAPKAKASGKLGAILAALTTGATGALGGYLLGRRKTKKEEPKNESA